MIENNKLKFLHFNNEAILPRKKDRKSRSLYQSRTVAALAVSPAMIARGISEFLTMDSESEVLMPITAGVAVVSFEDTYNRKLGRDMAVRHMAELDLKIESVKMNLTHLYINLSPVSGVELTLRVNRKTGFSSVLGKIVGNAR